MSLVVVASALPFRAAAVPFASVAANWPVIAAMLLGIALVLVLGHDAVSSGAMLTGTA